MVTLWQINLAFSDIASTEYPTATAAQAYQQREVHLQTRVDHEVIKTGQALQNKTEEHKNAQEAAPGVHGTEGE